MSATHKYEEMITDARSLLADAGVIRALLDEELSSAMLHRFLIEFSARAVVMTEPVDRWIRTAGQRCIEIGLDGIGKSLVKHSAHEAGHHLMLIDDTRHLVAQWNARSHRRIDADELLSAPPLSAARRYIALHEEVLAGPEPFAQVAVELEIEGMSVSFGPKLLEQCKRLLGREVLEGTSFLREHVEIDVGHTALNKKMLERLLAVRPEAVDTLVAAGTRAIATYVEFFEECWHLASRGLESQPVMEASI